MRSQFEMQHQPHPSRGIRRSYRAVLALVVGGALLATAVPLSATAAPAPQSLFPAAVSPAVLTDSDTVAVQLGVKFTSAVGGQVTGVKFYKGPQNTGTHTGALWTSGGTKLATATFKNETASGWQTATFSTPVAITAGKQYVASYLAPKGRYSATNHGFDTRLKSGDLTAPAGAGVYKYGTTGALTQMHQNTNYFVDVVFVAGTGTTPIALQTVQPAGKGAMAAADWWRGLRSDTLVAGS